MSILQPWPPGGMIWEVESHQLGGGSGYLHHQRVTGFPGSFQITQVGTYKVRGNLKPARSTEHKAILQQWESGETHLLYLFPPSLYPTPDAGKEGWNQKPR